MHRIRLFYPALVISFVVATANGYAIEKDKPNIVLLYADDAGYADFGFQPNVRDDMKSLTPKIDSIARNGVRFSNAYMSGAVCSPSRAGMMTGRYQSRFGHDNNIPPGYMKGGLPKSETFGAKRLQALGYKTGIVGKWHLGYPAGFQPNDRGFDWFYGCLQGSRSYFPMKKPTPHRVFLENRTPTDEKGYTTDRIGDAACRFIKSNADKPFFLFVSFTAPHGPLQAKESDLAKLDHIENQKRKKYAGLIKALDDNVGKILATIKDSGMEQNTLVIFTNDNGGQTLTGANNFPLRGRKGTLWEGGTRVPMCMKWPGKIPKGDTISAPVISLDFLPTFVEMAGAKVDPKWKLDGRSILGIVTAKDDKFPTRTMFWRQHGSSGSISCREGKWKLVYQRATANAKPELYDLSKDISEQTNLADQFPDQTKALIAKIKDWESQLKEPQWGKNAVGSKKGKKKR